MIHIPWVWSLHEKISSDLTVAAGVVERVLQALENERWSEQDRFGIHLSLEEALANAIKHGNQSDSKKTVQVKIQLAKDRIRMEVSDQGRGFNMALVPDPTTEANLDVPSGRGLFLMFSYMNFVEFNETGNRVTMEKLRPTAN